MTGRLTRPIKKPIVLLLLQPDQLLRNSFYRYLIVPLCMLLVFGGLVSCGGSDIASGGGDGGTGLGGSGISYVRGNISELNGVRVVSYEGQRAGSCGLPSSCSYQKSSLAYVSYIMDVLVVQTVAQVLRVSDIVVSGGGSVTMPDSSGNFELAGVPPSDNFILEFSVQGNLIASISLGSVEQNSVVQVSDITINSSTRIVKPASITSESIPPSHSVSDHSPGNSGNASNQNGNNGNNIQGNDGKGNSENNGKNNNGNKPLGNSGHSGNGMTVENNSGQGNAGGNSSSQGNAGGNNQGQGNSGGGNQGQGNSGG